MIRIKDIAEKCGVSTATVSYVLHGKTGKVSPAVREKIEKEIQDCGYISNQSALSLVSRCSGLIGVAVMNLGNQKSIMSDPYFGILFSYLEKEFKKNDKYILILLDQSPEEIVKDALRWNLDGLILCNHKKDTMVKISSQYVKPIITIDASFVHEYNKLVQVFIDDYDGGYQMGKYFVQMGHKNVAMLDDCGFEEDRHRWRGFKQALNDSGIRIDETSHHAIEIKKEEFSTGIERVYPKLKDKTAIFCVSDYYAIQLMKYLAGKGIRVPDDISVAGYDDIVYSKLYVPELTTIRQNVEEKAVVAVKSMMDLIAGKEVEHNIKLPVELVIRDSVKKL